MSALKAIGLITAGALGIIFFWPGVKSDSAAAPEIAHQDTGSAASDRLRPGQAVTRESHSGSAESDGQQNAEVDGVVKSYWFENDDLVQEISDDFSDYFALRMPSDLAEVQEKRAGSSTMKSSEERWDSFPEQMRPLMTDYEGLSEAELYGAAFILNDALSDAIHSSDPDFKERFTDEGWQEYQNNLFEHPLSYSPENVLMAYGGHEWRQWPGFAEEFNSVRAEYIRGMAQHRWTWQVCYQVGNKVMRDKGLRKHYRKEQHLALISREAADALLSIENYEVEFRSVLAEMVERYKDSN